MPAQKAARLAPAAFLPIPPTIPTIRHDDKSSCAGEPGCRHKEKESHAGNTDAPLHAAAREHPTRRTQRTAATTRGAPTFKPSSVGFVLAQQPNTPTPSCSPDPVARKTLGLRSAHCLWHASPATPNAVRVRRAR